jgi:hypothetical protein
MLNKEDKKRLFLVLRRDIKGAINYARIIRSPITRIDITLEDGTFFAKTTKIGIEEHLLQRNLKVYRAAGLTPFGDTDLGRCLGPYVSSSLAKAILEGSYEDDNFASNAIVKQLKRRENIAMQPRPTIMETYYSNAFGGLREASANSPSGIYNTLYKCLASKKGDGSSHPARLILSRMMSMPIIHGFAPERHLTRHECAIHKKPGKHKSETMRIVHLVEATENRTQKNGVAWKIKQLVKRQKGIFHEFQFGKPKSTCISAIIIKTMMIDTVNV